MFIQQTICGKPTYEYRVQMITWSKPSRARRHVGLQKWEKFKQLATSIKICLPCRR